MLFRSCLTMFPSHDNRTPCANLLIFNALYMVKHLIEPKLKNWWTPVWRGLVVDEQGKHCQAMDGAVWLYLYLLVHADRGTGRVLRRYQTIARDMGRPVATIRRWLSTLRQHDYLTVTHTSHSLVIHIQKWKSLPERKPSAQI